MNYNGTVVKSSLLIAMKMLQQCKLLIDPMRLIC